MRKLGLLVWVGLGFGVPVPALAYSGFEVGVGVGRYLLTNDEMFKFAQDSPQLGFKDQWSLIGGVNFGASRGGRLYGLSYETSRFWFREVSTNKELTYSESLISIPVTQFLDEKIGDGYFWRLAPGYAFRDANDLVAFRGKGADRLNGIGVTGGFGYAVSNEGAYFTFKIEGFVRQCFFDGVQSTFVGLQIALMSRCGPFGCSEDQELTPN